MKAVYIGASGTRYALSGNVVTATYTWGTVVPMTFANSRLAWTYATQHGKREVKR